MELQIDRLDCVPTGATIKLMLPFQFKGWVEKQCGLLQASYSISIDGRCFFEICYCNIEIT